MRRVTFFVLVIVVVLRTTMVTWRLPHLSTEATEPEKRLPMTIFFVAVGSLRWRRRWEREHRDGEENDDVFAH